MILLTGASGTIGTQTVKALKAKGAAFKVGLRSPEKAAALGAEGIAFDWEKPDTYRSALSGVDTVFLLTPSVEKQVEFATGLTAAAKASGVKRIVKLSVIGAEAEPGIAFGRVHRDVEQAIKASGLAWTFLRPTFFMQNFPNFYGLNPKADSTIYLPNEDAKVSWIDARDIGDVAAAALTDASHEGKAYDLTGGEALSTAEACALFSTALGQKISYVNVTEAAARDAMTSQGMSGSMVEGYLELHVIIRRGWCAAIGSGVHEALGRAPRTLAQYAADFAAGNA